MKQLILIALLVVASYAGAGTIHEVQPPYFNKDWSSSSITFTLLLDSALPKGSALEIGFVDPSTNAGIPFTYSFDGTDYGYCYQNSDDQYSYCSFSKDLAANTIHEL